MNDIKEIGVIKMQNKDIKVLVLMGGVSTEREVSLRSGAAVADALKDAGYTVETLDITRENVFRISEIKPDVAFLALHGEKGEDGCVQGLLEWMGIPYTGPGVASSAICMDKNLTKKILKQQGITTPDFIEYSKYDDKSLEEVLDEVKTRFGFPVVVKSPCQGSSIGVVMVNGEKQLLPAVEECLRYGDKVLFEEFIDGIEVTVPIMGNDELTVLPIIEIESENEFYDFESKYTQGMCRHIIPARISEDVWKKVEETAQKAYRAALCKGLSRVDFIIDNNGNPNVIEINTLPGMTQMSLFPDSARFAGIEFPELVDKIVKYALERQG